MESYSEWQYTEIVIEDSQGNQQCIDYEQSEDVYYIPAETYQYDT